MRSLTVFSLLVVAFLVGFVSCRPEEVLDKVEDGADEVKDNAKSVFDTIKDTVAEKAHQAKDLAEDFADYTSKKVHKKDRVTEFRSKLSSYLKVPSTGKMVKAHFYSKNSAFQFGTDFYFSPTFDKFTHPLKISEEDFEKKNNTVEFYLSGLIGRPCCPD